MCHGLVFKPSVQPFLQGFIDANWGRILMIEDQPVVLLFFLDLILCSGLQENKTQSPSPVLKLRTEPLLMLHKRCYGFHFLLGELGVVLPSAPIIWCENLTTVSLAANAVLHSKIKHTFTLWVKRS